MAEHDVAARLDHGDRNAGPLQHRERVAQDMSLRHTTKVEVHAGPCQAHGARRRIKFQELPADACARRVPCRTVRQAARLSRLPPECHQRSECRVEGAIAGLGNFPGNRQDPEQLSADRNPPAGLLLRPPRELTYLAPGAIVTEHILQLGDAIEGRLGGRQRSGLRVGMEDDRHRHPHVEFGELVAGWGLGAGHQGQAGGSDQNAYH